MKQKHIIIFITILIVGYLIYFTLKKKSAKPQDVTIKMLSPKEMSNRLQQMELVDKDVSNMEAGFLKAWLTSAEEALVRGEGGLPGWEYEVKFNYKGTNYFLKGGTINNPNKE